MRKVFAAALAGSFALLALGGCNKSDESRSSEAPVSGEQKVEANEKGFSPSSITVKKGSTTHLLFTRTSASTCATEVVFPDLGIQKELPLGTPVSVDIPADQDRTLHFACGMKMFEGKVVVK